MVSLRIPVATYRLQFSRGIHFEDARAIVPYLNQLGISDLYASPVFKARQGSLHGYDVTDPTCLNPELGREQEFESLVQKLQVHKMGLLLDVVPNHMAASLENSWWMDVLENGQASPYATYFDIRWNPSNHALSNKVLLPILGVPYIQALENRELTLILEEAGLFINYYDYKLPINIKSYINIISHQLNTLEGEMGANHPSFQDLLQMLTAIEHLPFSTGRHARETEKNWLARQQTKNSLWRLINTSPEIKSFLLKNIALFNGEKENSQNFDLLDKLLSQQAYQLTFWKTALTEINYRRFFDINELIGIKVDDKRVFEATHALILRLISQGKVTGLRIDHIDGLYDPFKYLHRLQHYLSQKAEGSARQPGFYIIVEKILNSDENLPEEWPVFGTTGYDFLNVVNNLFIDEEGVQNMKAVYTRFTGSESAFEDVVYQKKKQVIENLFVSEIRSLVQKLVQLSQQDWYESALSQDELEKALVEVTACLPVYRTYIRSLRISPQDRLHLRHAIEDSQRRNPTLEVSALKFLKTIMSLKFPMQLSSEEKKEWLCFVMQWQQFTGAAMAKGAEDTAFYNFNFLISLNEVGGNPGEIAPPIAAFHQHNVFVQKNWPYTLNATATHDTKRGEDVRARLNVLSEIPEIWENYLIGWNHLNQEKKQNINGRPVPDPNTEIHLYQTLLGAWPFSDKEVPQFKERVKAYMLKATREAKVFSSWLSPNPDYESAILSFIDIIMEDSDQNDFLENFLELQKQVAFYGALNSLTQVLLKITSSGIPDFYGGNELWDLSLVDPDNRRPVDFKKRMRLLDNLIGSESQVLSILIDDILASWRDGRVKLYTTYKALGLRRTYRDIFQQGNYIPVQVHGLRKEHVCSFIRHWENNWALIAVPRLLTRVVPVDKLPLGSHVWGDDILILPQGAKEYWLNIFTGETIKLSSSTKGMSLADIFHKFPVALLIASSTK